MKSSAPLPIDAAKQRREESPPPSTEAGTATKNAETVADEDAGTGAIPQLTEKQMAALAKLHRGETITAVAESVGVDRSTIHRWLKEPLFAAERERLKQETYDRIQAKALALAESALESVEGVISFGYPARDVLGAAKVLLKLAGLDNQKQGF